VAAIVTARAGIASLFLYTAVVHVALLVFTLIRIGTKATPADETREPFEPMPEQASPMSMELDPRGPEQAA
jgi:hypothetical protein